jgi:peptide/nickel transport system permease protein
VTAYLARRLLQSVAVVVLVTLIVFTLIALAPGRAMTGIIGSGAGHQQFLVQYLTWLGRVVRGNLGFSVRQNETVWALLVVSLPRTLILMGLSTVLALVVGIPLGLLQAVRRNTVTDQFLRIVTYACYGIPTFVVGAVLILFFATGLHVFGAEGPQAPGVLSVLTDTRDLTLPVVTLSLVSIATFARYTRAAAVDNLLQEYVEAARARGAGQRRVLTRHVLRNSLVPVVTLLGLSFPQIIGGAVVVERLFNFPGMGWQIWQAAENKDFAVTLGFTLVIAIAACAGSLVADLGYALLDPRVRYAPR